MAKLQKVTILSIALLLSLSVNIGLASFMAGRKAVEANNAPRPAAGALLEILRTLPPEQRQAVRRAVEQRRPELRQAILALRDQRQAVAALLQNDHVDEEALNAALADLRARTTAAQEAGHRFLTAVLPHLSTEQRRELIERQRNLVR